MPLQGIPLDDGNSTVGWWLNCACKYNNFEFMILITMIFLHPDELIFILFATRLSYWLEKNRGDVMVDGGRWTMGSIVETFYDGEECLLGLAAEIRGSLKNALC